VKFEVHGKRLCHLLRRGWFGWLTLMWPLGLTLSWYLSIVRLFQLDESGVSMMSSTKRCQNDVVTPMKIWYYVSSFWLLLAMCPLTFVIKDVKNLGPLKLFYYAQDLADMVCFGFPPAPSTSKHSRCIKVLSLQHSFFRGFSSFFQSSTKKVVSLIQFFLLKNKMANVQEGAWIEQFILFENLKV